ncbi:MAG: rhodanese-like domain-containing protein [Firmicutes bacterium]|nr:rhodanese-like domain-containing protein [Bacillota bacterium]
MFNISIRDLKKIVHTASIIDIRSIASYNNNHIPGSKNIPFEVLISKPDKYLNKSDIYYIYCQKGHKSLKVCQILNSLGYSTKNIIGGYEAWILDK